MCVTSVCVAMLCRSGDCNWPKTWALNVRSCMVWLHFADLSNDKVFLVKTEMFQPQSFLMGQIISRIMSRKLALNAWSDS